jgi:O-antigen/teichoic acid export membrane protein
MIERAWSKLRSRLFPHGVAATSERDKDRYIRAGRSMAFNAVSAALGLMVLLCSVSLTLPYLGQERFGVWMTISSLAAMLSLLDLGVGNGLVNLVAHAKSTDEHWRLQTIVSRGVWLLIAIGVLAALVLAGALSIVGLNRVIKIQSQAAAHEAQTSVLVFIALFCANIPLGGVRKVFQGLQRALVRTAPAVCLRQVPRTHSLSDWRNLWHAGSWIVVVAAAVVQGKSIFLPSRQKHFNMARLESATELRLGVHGVADRRNVRVGKRRADRLAHPRRV